MRRNWITPDPARIGSVNMVDDRMLFNHLDRKRILYVEGYEDNRVLLAYLLKELNYRCTAVANITEALSVAQSEVFDLYILDSWYSDGTGIELCKRIRGFDQVSPIIFFSAWPLDSAREEAIRAGASAYLLKPGLEDVLLFIGILLGDRNSVSRNARIKSELTSPTKSPAPNAVQSHCGTQAV